MFISQLSKLNISAKFRLLILIPCTAVLFFGGFQTYQYFQEIKQARQAKTSISISLSLDKLIFELQKERGLTEGYLSSNLQQHAKKLSKQRQQTDLQIQAFDYFYKTLDLEHLQLKSIASQQAINAVLQEINQAKSLLSDIRISVDNKQQANYFNYYSNFIKYLLRLVQQVQVNLKDIQQNRFSIDFINLLHLQEKAGQERGALNGVLTLQTIELEQLQKIIAYAAAQNKLIEDLFSISLSHHQAWLDVQLASQVNQQVILIRKRIHNKIVRAELLNSIEHQIGYGGLIHHFKNYILRGDKLYIEKFNKEIQSISLDLAKFEQLENLTSNERQALNVLKMTLEQYRRYISVAQQLRVKNKTVESIDLSVRIDDKPAVEAIAQLKRYDFIIDSDAWWKIASARIDLFREVSYHISKEMEALAITEENNAIQALLFYFFTFVLVFSVMLYISFYVIKHLVSEIKHIADTMHSMQKDHRFDIPLQVKGKDEISEMAQAFNSMIAERQKTESELKISAAVFKYASEAIMITNANNEIEMVNPAFCSISGYSVDEVLGKNPAILNSGMHDAHFYKEMWDELITNNNWQGEIWNKRKNGEIYPEFLAISVVKDQFNKPIQYISLFSDITKHKKYEEDIWLQANYDALTDLPNRNLCLERLHYELSSEHHKNVNLALLFIDLDRFKYINDTWGHKSGDELLKMAAVRLSDCLRNNDTVARFGGDEFVVILSGTSSVHEVERIVKNIVSILSAPFYLSNGHDAVVSASIGITLSPTDGKTPEELLKNADTAMYQAKDAGRNTYKFYTDSMNKMVTARMQLEQELRQAIKQQEFVLYYQPVVSLNNGNVTGAEALIRWQHPKKGLIYPDEFISVAEETGLIEPIGQWVIEQALQDLKHWHSLGLMLNVAVNVSSRQCNQSSQLVISAVISQALQKNNIAPSYLKVEITESLLMDNSQQMINTLQEIKDLGVAIHMDDFGTGYSSLSYLKRFPINVLKIDRSFIEGAIEDEIDASLVQAVVLIGHSLNLKLVGEGIETQAHYDYLKQLGCDFGQGYHIAKPLAPDVFIPWVQQQATLCKQSVFI